MATNKKQTAGAGGGTAALALPEGFSTGRNKFYAEGVARRFDMLPPEGFAGGGAGVRVLLVANKGVTHEQVMELLGGHVRYQLRMEAPGIYEATLRPRDMENVVAPNVGSDKTFRWVDLGNRFFGLTVGNAADTAARSQGH